MLKPLAFAFVAFGTIAAASAASAVTLSYTLTCASGPTICDQINNAEMTFQLPQLPVPSELRPPNEFEIDNVQALWDGSATPIAVSVVFSDRGSGNGVPGILVRWNTNNIGGGGDQMFQGPRNAPRLSAGTFTVAGTTFIKEHSFASHMAWFVDIVAEPGANPAPVPLPASFGLLAGALGLGALVRRGSRKRA